MRSVSGSRGGLRTTGVPACRLWPSSVRCAATVSNHRGTGRAPSETSAYWRVIRMIGTAPSRRSGAIGLPTRSARWSSRSHHSDTTESGVMTGTNTAHPLTFVSIACVHRSPESIRRSYQNSRCRRLSFRGQALDIRGVRPGIADEHEPHTNILPDSQEPERASDDRRIRHSACDSVSAPNSGPRVTRRRSGFEPSSAHRSADERWRYEAGARQRTRERLDGPAARVLAMDEDRVEGRPCGYA